MSTFVKTPACMVTCLTIPNLVCIVILPGCTINMSISDDKVAPESPFHAQLADLAQRFGYIQLDPSSGSDNEPPKVAALKEWVRLRTPMLLTLQDGRHIQGQLVCFDKHKNIVLAECYELKKALPPSRPAAQLSKPGATTSPTDRNTAAVEMKKEATKPSASSQKRKGKGKATQAKQAVEKQPELAEFVDEYQQQELENRNGEEKKFERYMVRYDHENQEEVRYQGLVLVSRRHIKTASLDVSNLPTQFLPASLS